MVKHIERILMKVVVIQIICLVIAQVIMMNHQLSPFLSKVIQYEGVTKDTYTKVVETFDR
ncbi:YpfB family protein [Bacillus sp. DJP31]|uniref:YpfB family protein n=1 Tax=Bacillus sp. DJP31 TaxID=3409789 RepID=UPI003BB6C5AF